MTAPPPSDPKKTRLAEALRSNLKRRKAAARRAEAPEKPRTAKPKPRE